MAKGLLAHGVTSFCPTLVTSLPKVYHEILPRIRKTNGGANGANILGVHLEGPFINAEKKGAHERQCIRDFDNVLEFIMPGNFNLSKSYLSFLLYISDLLFTYYN